MKRVYVNHFINNNKKTKEKKESLNVKIKPKLLNNINQNFITSEKKFMKYHGFNKRKKFNYNLNSLNKIRDKYPNMDNIKILQFFLKKKLKIINKDMDVVKNECEIAKNDLVSVYDILWQKCTVAEAVQSIVPNFDVIQSELKLDDINFEFATKPELLTNLKSALDSVKSSYDFIIIDTPPAISIANQAAMIASDEIIIVVQPDQFNLDGLYQMNSAINNIKNKYNPNLSIAGILVNRYAERTTLRKEMRKELERVATNLGTKVYQSFVRDNVAIPESQVLKMSVFKYKKKSNGAIDYFKFLLEFMQDNGESLRAEDIPMGLRPDV